MCLLGSANFTRGAFHTNREACVLFGHSDDQDGSIKASLDDTFKQYWALGKHFSPKELETYRVLHKRSRSKIEPLAGEFEKGKQGRPVLDIPILTMSWSEFFEAVSADPLHSLAARITVLTEARRLFEQYRRFDLMPTDDRQRVAGFRGRSQMDWKWFGSMHGAGYFKNRINANDPNLSLALDAIPPTGDVSKEHYLEFVDTFRAAFPDGRGHGLAPATRLLALKRPDYFVCVASANRVGLGKAFDITLGHHQYERYWTSVIERVLLSTWWNSSRPKNDTEMKVWDGRTAFLDSLYYPPARPS